MSKTTKIWIVTATLFVLIGGMVFAGVMTVLKWDFTKLSTVKYETSDYEVKEKFDDISIITNTADILFVPYENKETYVICYEQKNVRHSVTVQDGKLLIEVIDTRKWYEYISINIGKPAITVYIPQGEYGKLLVKSATGNVEIPKEFKFENIDIFESTGDVTNYASASENIKIKVSTGDIRVENISASTLDLSVSTGKTSLTDILCENVISSGNTGDMYLNNVIAAKKLSVERSTGDVKFDGCDAAEIFIQTDTGDVKGSLLTDKIYVVKTDTGKVNVPKTANGGKCEITTSTGDINVTTY